jgi:hypothetical protein
MCSELQECPQGCQPGVAAPHRIMTHLFQVIEKCQNQLGRNIGQFCGVWRSTQVCLGKIQEQHKGIPVRRHSARAHRPLLCQVLGEECLHQG